ncbi:MAG: hypothetical protein KJ795_13115 [Gammaproteobacteria bacterium]|nr:hypothetical protein [Gammaproteobacteria bacterium]MBU1775640.1 hypothetical protein [Gammaproteobacteria bacterium]MBU1968318.1 hypothetical protein [Gammaproteobacteria bacterium]
MRLPSKSVLLAVVAACAGGPCAAADDFKSFRERQQQEVQQHKAEFQAYKEQQDGEFAEYLKSQWREFETFQGKVRIKEPKPRQVPMVVPVAPTRPIAKPPRPDAPPAALPPPVPVAPIVQPVLTPPPPPPQPKSLPVAANTVELAFYGNPVRFVFDPLWKTYRLSGAAKPEAMSAFWGTMSGSRYESTIQAVNEARRTLKLDDWGHVTLWRSVVQALQPERRAEQNLLLWYFLVKSGYDVRLGYSGADVHLFVAVKQQVYSTKFTSVGSQTYYAVLDEDRGKCIRSFYTYEASYPNKLKPLDIQSAATGFTRTVPAQRALSFDYRGEAIALNVPYDRRLVEYMGSFPQSEFELYFDTDGSALIRASLLADLKKLTAKMDEEETVNFLLAFVQKAFAYKTDADQFGYEKYFFVEESLFFPYNDCEDRSVLFAWLAHELLGIKAVGLLFPGHMTTAVALKRVKAGFATVDFQGRRYVVADPTYIGATVGMAMPSYANLKPSRVVEILR